MSDTAAPSPTRGNRPTRIAPIIVVVIAVIVAGLMWVLIAADPGGRGDTADTPLLNKPAPAVRTTTVDGEPFDLQRRKGSWVFLNFFNSTCVPCIQEHPDLLRFAEQQSTLGVDAAELYTIVWDDDVDDVMAFFDEQGITWPVLTDDDAAISVAFAVAKVPETWLIDPDGRVVMRSIAPVTDEFLTQRLTEAKAIYYGVPE